MSTAPTCPSQLIGVVDGGAAGPVDLIAANPATNRTMWDVYRTGLSAAYAAIGAGHLAPPPDPPSVATTLVLAQTACGKVIGGSRLREGTDLPTYPGLDCLADTIISRETEGLNEAAGSWVDPAARGMSLGTTLLQAVMSIAAGKGNRYTVGFCNQFNLSACQAAGFVLDERFIDMPFPNESFRSTLVWFDHGATRVRGNDLRMAA